MLYVLYEYCTVLDPGFRAAVIGPSMTVRMTAMLTNNYYKLAHLQYCISFSANHHHEKKRIQVNNLWRDPYHHHPSLLASSIVILSHHHLLHTLIPITRSIRNSYDEYHASRS